MMKGQIKIIVYISSSAFGLYYVGLVRKVL
jgi:hypothetical protein